MFGCGLLCDGLGASLRGGLQFAGLLAAAFLGGGSLVAAFPGVGLFAAALLVAGFPGAGLFRGPSRSLNPQDNEC